MASLGALKVAPINQAAHSLLAYVPHLITAAVIGIAGYLVSDFVSQAVLIAAVNAGLPPARWIAAGTRWGIQLLAVAMAFEQLGIAQHIRPSLYKEPAHLRTTYHRADVMTRSEQSQVISSRGGPVEQSVGRPIRLKPANLDNLGSEAYPYSSNL